MGANAFRTDGSVIPRITAEINEGKIDKPMAIYYFSDFEDYVDDKDTDEFSKLLQGHSIRFYAHSVEKEPADAIKRLCTDTGGAWTLKELKTADEPSIANLSATSANN